MRAKSGTFYGVYPYHLTSGPELGDDETTALFVIHIHLASQVDLDASAKWVKYKEDSSEAHSGISPES